MNKCWIVFLAGLLLQGAALADIPQQLQRLQADNKAWDKAVEDGKRQAAFCFNCHGENGIAMQEEIPNLAGQPVTYLLDQIDKFGRGVRRDEFMQRLISVLTQEEKLNIAAYFSAQPIKPIKNTSSADINAGKIQYEKLCIKCHGDRGKGKDLTPTVAGQQETYLIKSLKRYRDNTGERLHKEMSEATANLSNSDINNLSAYQHQLK